MKRTALHEIMHALGFQHEHQRKDRNKYLDVRTRGSQYDEKCNGITPFDPFSVMMYNPDNETLIKKQGASVWQLKNDDIEN